MATKDKVTGEQQPDIVYVALDTVNHNGVCYKPGEKIPDLKPMDAHALELLGVITEH